MKHVETVVNPLHTTTITTHTNSEYLLYIYILQLLHTRLPWKLSVWLSVVGAETYLTCIRFTLFLLGYSWSGRTAGFFLRLSHFPRILILQLHYQTFFLIPSFILLSSKLKQNISKRLSLYWIFSMIWSYVSRCLFAQVFHPWLAFTYWTASWKYSFSFGE